MQPAAPEQVLKKTELASNNIWHAACHYETLSIR